VYEPTDEASTLDETKLSSAYSVPILKSNLQKAIRRQKTEAALSTTHQLVLQDLKSLLRRLPIISIEDVSWLTDVNRIVWCMAAHSKGFKLRLHQIQLLYKVVWNLCHLSTCTKWSTPSQSLEPRILIQRQFNILKKSLDPSVLNVRTSVLVRISFGGMKGDLNLLDWLGHHPKTVVTSSYPSPCFTITPLSFNSSHQLLEAVDFHCTKIGQEAAQKFGINPSFMKEIIWTQRSRVNVRKPWQITPPPYWWELVNLWLDEESRRLWLLPPPSLPKRKLNHTSSRSKSPYPSNPYKITDYFQVIPNKNI